MRLYIKNMVCNRCIEAVEDELRKLDITYSNIGLGYVDLNEIFDDSNKSIVSDYLNKRGFELLEDKKSQVIEQIKALVLESIQNSNKLTTNYSSYLEKGIGKDYNQLSTMFSTVEGVTVERYIILQRLERVKELLIYDELSLSEIAYQTGYSSVHHLSNQFKKNIGMSPSQFKKLHNPPRKPLDQV
ncbi:MAG: AraC family transcriptional regulator [Bacteroidota bacterium]